MEIDETLDIQNLVIKVSNFMDYPPQSTPILILGPTKAAYILDGIYKL